MIDSMERKSTISDFQLPPGFRFHPSDEELIIHYLKNKVTSTPLPATIIAEIDLYKYNPWDLPMKALFGEEEWFFFTPRERKYPNGARPNRAAGLGYWKATGTDRPILSSCGTKSIGVKKGLVFYKGRPPKGTKTDWIMHEYRLIDTIVWTPRLEGSMRLDDWVLCRVRQKSSNPGVSWDDRHIFPTEHQPEAILSNLSELLPSSITNPNIEMAKHFLYNGCPMLPYMLASHDHHHHQQQQQQHQHDLQPSSSIISFQSSDKSCISSVHEETFPVSNSIESLFDNSMKRKAADDLVTQSNWINNRKELTSTSNDLNSQQWNSLMQYEGFNQLDFIYHYST